jgi:hypothetical protein
MDAPLSILKVQMIAGHSDLKTTMRYVHSDGVRGTSSLQWSREERRRGCKALRDPQMEYLKVRLRMIKVLGLTVMMMVDPEKENSG